MSEIAPIVHRIEFTCAPEEDQETRALRSCLMALGPLDAEEAHRVTAYLAERFPDVLSG